MTTPETPSEVMRRAAGLMRERVAELPPSPWRAEGRDVMATQDYHGDDWEPDWDFGLNVAVCRRQDEAEYIASWGPGVALAVAEWLEGAAAEAEAALTPGLVCGRCGGYAGSADEEEGARCRCWDRALAVAHAYLGGIPEHPVTATGGKDINDKGGNDD